MEKEIALITNIIGSSYFMGGMLLQTEGARKTIEVLDRGFKNTLLALKEKKLVQTTDFIAKLFGILTLSALISFVMMGVLKIQSAELAFALLTIFGISGLFFGSVLWVLKHNQVVVIAGKILLFFGVGSLLFPAMDLLTGLGFTNITYVMLQSSLEPLIALPSNQGFIFESCIVFGIYTGSVILFYLIAWLYALPITVIAFIIVSAPILGSRAINRAFPEKPIAAIFFTMWLISLIYMANAG